VAGAVARGDVVVAVAPAAVRAAFLSDDFTIAIPTAKTTANPPITMQTTPVIRPDLPGSSGVVSCQSV
jgi:hypothetical protein